MSFQFIVRRYWLNLKRYRTFAFLIAIVFAAGLAFFNMIYPGPEFIDTIVSIPIFQILIGGITDVENPGLLVWILLILSIFSNILTR